LGRPNYSFEKRRKELKKAKKKEEKAARRAAKRGDPIPTPSGPREPQPTPLPPSMLETPPPAKKD
jgi:hypothetical protein